MKSEELIMINVNNLCTFEGRIVKDPQISTQGQGQNSYTKALFTLAIDRKLTKEQREAKKNGVEGVYSDFVPFVANGTLADVIKNYFVKGKPIKVIATYQSYQTKDQSGNVKYGHIFKVEDLGFVTKDTTDGQGGGNTGGGNNNNGNRNNNNGGNNKPANNRSNNNQNDYMPVDDGDIPF